MNAADDLLLPFSLSRLNAKSLVLDPAFWTALAVLLSHFLPGAAVWWQANHDALWPLVVVLGGHFLVRHSAVRAKGQAVAAVAPEIARLETVFPASHAAAVDPSVVYSTNPPTGAPADQAEPSPSLATAPPPAVEPSNG